MSLTARLVMNPAPHYSGALWLVVWAVALLSMPAATEAEPLPHPPGGACQTPAVAGDSVLSAEFWRTDSDTITATFGQSVVIAGRLADGDGAPLPDATLCVEEWLIGAGAGAADRIAVPRIGLAHTDAAGAYTYRLPPGPNREAVVVYGDGSAVALRYFAAAMPTLEAAPKRTRNRGRPVRFWGRLPGPQAGGRVLALQAKAGNRWITFSQTTTDRSGRFRAHYRFQRTFERTVYRFRARVPRQAGYPWLAGSSKPISVLVK